MQLNNKIKIIDLALLIENNLVISDVHLGYEESLNKKGILVPKFQFKDTINRLEKIFEQLEEEKIILQNIVVNGDLKHQFGKISDDEWRDVLNLIDYLIKKVKNKSNLIIIKGNHDKVSEYIAEKRDLQLVNLFVIGDVLIVHGDVIPKIDTKIKTIVIGHEHPAITLRDNVRSETFKCFLRGEWKSEVKQNKRDKKTNNKKQTYELIVMPSFNLVTEGTNILREKLLSPFLNEQDIKKFEVFVVADEVRYFGRVGDLISE